VSKFPIFYETWKIFNDFSRENHGHGGHEHGVRRGFSDVSFHLRRCPQGIASLLCKKTFFFDSRRSKLDHLTVPPGTWRSAILSVHKVVDAKGIREIFSNSSSFYLSKNLPADVPGKREHISQWQTVQCSSCPSSRRS
jgi:hypothetical protein